MFVPMSALLPPIANHHSFAYRLLGVTAAAIGADGRDIAARLVAGTAEPGEGRTLRRLVSRLREALRTRALWRREHGLPFDDDAAFADLAVMLEGFTPHRRRHPRPPCQGPPRRGRPRRARPHVPPAVRLPDPGLACRPRQRPPGAPAR
jgi:hypothetical protein